MSEEAQTTPATSALETALSSLAPAPAKLSREAILYAAGRQAGLTEAPPRPRAAERWLWLSTAALLIASLTMTALYVRQRQAGPVIVTVPRQTAPGNPTDTTELTEPDETAAADDRSDLAQLPAPSANYLHMRRAVLDEGWDALPERNAVSDSREVAIPTWRGALSDI